MLDCHVLTLPQRGAVFSRCFESLSSRRARVWPVTGVEGHIGQGRYAGFAMGDAPFVTYVDDDDMVQPGLLDALVDVLRQHPDAALLHVGNRSVASDARVPGGRVGVLDIARRRPSPRLADHMNVFRRDLLQPHLRQYLDFPRGGDSAVLQAYVTSLAHPHYMLHCPQQLYLKRRR